eukprot:Gb_25558 [translate_table: standard]
MELARVTWQIVIMHSGGSHVLFLDHLSINSQSWHTLSVRGIVSSQIGSTGPSDSGGDRATSRPSHGDRSCIPWYVSDDEFLDAIVDDACQEYATSTSMSIDVQTGIHIKHSEQPSVNFPSCTATPEVIACPDITIVVSQTHDSMTSPLGVEATTCPDTNPMASVPESVLGSQTHDPTTAAGIDGHHVIGRWSRQTDEDLEDGNRSQRLRPEIDTKDIVPLRDSISS